MALTTTSTRNAYTGDGTTATYAYSYRVFLNSDLKVTVKKTSTLVETELTLTTDYTVTDVGSTDGNIILVDASQDWIDSSGFLATGYTMVIRRVKPLTQTADIRNQGSYFPETHEDVFDKHTMVDQQLQDQLDRSIKLPETVLGSDLDPTLPTTLTADYFLKINSTGDGLALATGIASGVTIGSGTGIVAKTSASATVVRTLTGTANEITITNGDGVSANPTFTLADRAVTTITADYTVLSTDKTILVDGISDNITVTLPTAVGNNKIFNIKQINNTQILTDTFVDGDVTVGTDNINVASHPFTDLQKIQLTSSGTLPAGLALATDYYVIFVDANNIELASSRVNAVANTAVDITAAAGGGTHTITSQVNTITIDGNASETIDGFANITLNKENDSVRLVSDGTNFETITARISQTSQRFATGSGTYTTPLGVKYLKVRMSGGGGGGGGAGAGAGDGATGVDSTFGTSLLTASAGVLGQFFGNGPGGAGGAVTVNSPAVNLLSRQGGTGASGDVTGAHGGFGGSNGLGGAGGSQGITAVANTGGGGGGGGSGGASITTGGGAGAGGYIEAVIYNPDATYAYAVGAGGAGGTIGTSGSAGGVGGSGVIVVEEYY